MIVRRVKLDNQGVGSNYGLITSKSEAKNPNVSWFNSDTEEEVSWNNIQKVFLDLEDSLIWVYVKEVDQLILYDKSKEIFTVYSSNLSNNPRCGVTSLTRTEIARGIRLPIDCNNYQGLIATLESMLKKGFPAINPTNLKVYLKGIEVSDSEIDGRLLILWVTSILLRAERGLKCLKLKD